MVVPTLVLLVEDNPSDASSIAHLLAEIEDQQWQTVQTQSLNAALALLTQFEFTVVLYDLALTDVHWVKAISAIQEQIPRVPVVAIHHAHDTELAQQLLEIGVQDYLVKRELTAASLVRSVRFAIERHKIRQQLQTEARDHQRSEQTLRLIVEGTAAVTGTDFFNSLVRSLAQALSVHYAFISECLDTPPTQVRAFAFWNGTEFGEHFEYHLHGTPCEKVINGGGFFYCPQDVQAFFPEEEGLVEWAAQSYAGVVLKNSSNQILGHLAVLDLNPMFNEPRNRAILEIFASRAAAEMERKQAEASLRMSEDKFAKAFRSSPDAITISTLRDGRYIEVNESCLQMLGYQREEMIGQTASALNIWPRSGVRNTVMQLLATQGSISRLELQLHKKSGEILQGLFSAEIIQLEDEPCLLAVVTDITTLKQAEKALERLAEIGELAAMIVHEVRNPLTTVMMGLKAFQRLELPERFQEYLSLAMDEAGRLQRLLEQILVYAKPQNLNKIELDLHRFIPEILNTLRQTPLAQQKQLQWIPATKPVLVLADPDKLKQVVINLVTNALEAVSMGAVVTVQIQTDDLDSVWIQVQNPGDPIPPVTLERLTKPFFTTKSTGTGLGLAIVKRIVEAHEGELTITSTAEVGTTVSVGLRCSESGA